MKKFILITTMLVGSFAQAETYVCKQSEDEGGKTIAVLFLGENGAASIKHFDENLGVYNTAQGAQYTKTEGECPSRLCGNFHIAIQVEIPINMKGTVRKINGHIHQDGGSFAFYYQKMQTPIIYDVECSAE